MKKITLALIFFFAILAGHSRNLVLPQVPDTLRTVHERAAYVADHYWDTMDWTDRTLTDDVKFMEGASADFYVLLPLTDSISASNAVGRMLDAAASADNKIYERLSDIARLYLYEPESPIVNDESYLVVTDRLLADGRLSEAALLRISDVRESMMLNRTGHKASDIVLVDRSGRETTLYDALSRHPKSIVMFYDPDCHLCSETEQFLADNPPSDTGVILICPFGELDGLRNRHAATMPAEWTVAHPLDDDFEDSELYELRYIPTILLIASDATVLAKNLTLESLKQQ